MRTLPICCHRRQTIRVQARVCCESTAKGQAVIIDLGTIFSYVSVFYYDKVGITAKHEGNQTTPGARLIGCRLYDETVQACAKHWSFKVLNSATTRKSRRSAIAS
ncbi:Heat shock cognate 70 kDa protein, partial [Taenia solium]